MCLYVENKIELTAKKDIIVYKHLIQTENGWITPYQYTPVKLNSTLKAEPVGELYHNTHLGLIIKGGVIHASLEKMGPWRINHAIYKAVIKSGTRYYVSKDFSEIAAEELYITDTQVTGIATTPDRKVIYRNYLEAALSMSEFKNKDGVGIGYYRLPDGSYASPLEEFDKSKAIGIVVSFREDGEKPVIVGLCDMDEKSWKTYKTEGTNVGDWNLGSLGDFNMIEKNLSVINSSILLTGCGHEVDKLTIWLGNYEAFKGHPIADNMVRPFLN